MVITHGGGVFSAARALGRDWREIADFSASINPLGPASGVRQAITQAYERIVHYPDSAELGARLAAAWRVPSACVLTGNGATELLHFLARIAALPQVTIAVPAFSEFHRAYPHATLVPATAPETWPRVGWLILTNPLNPTGALLPREDLIRHLEASDDQPIVVDESFLDFTDEPSLAPLVLERDQLFILKSLTKFYALPGLRAGALVASEETIGALRSFRDPWQMNALADAAVSASLPDTAYADATRRFVYTEREWLSDQIQTLPRTSVFPSCTNYLAVKLGYSAGMLTAALRRRGILIRDCTSWPGVEGEVVRVAIRTRVENERLLSNWRDALCQL